MSQGSQNSPNKGKGPENKTQHLEVPLEVSIFVDSRSTGSFLEGIICVTNIEGDAFLQSKGIYSISIFYCLKIRLLKKKTCCAWV